MPSGFQPTTLVAAAVAVVPVALGVRDVVHVEDVPPAMPATQC